MSAPGPLRSPNIGQLIAVLAATIALFFMISFVGKSLQVHRLRVLQERLVAEQRLLMRERDELQQEVERRKSGLWAEELLRDAGWVPPGGVRVIPVTATPDPASQPKPQSSPASGQGAPAGFTTFNSPQWRAWLRLILPVRSLGREVSDKSFAWGQASSVPMS